MRQDIGLVTSPTPPIPHGLQRFAGEQLDARAAAWVDFQDGVLEVSQEVHNRCGVLPRRARTIELDEALVRIMLELHAEDGCECPSQQANGVMREAARGHARAKHLMDGFGVDKWALEH